MRLYRGQPKTCACGNAFYHPGSVCLACGERLQREADKAALDKFLADKESHINKMLTECGVPAEFMSAKTTDFPKHIQEGAVKEKGKSLFITGGYGCGKTHLSVAIFREFVSGLEVKKNEFGEYGFDKAYMPVFSVVTELLLDIRATFSADNGKNEKFIVDKYGDTNFLILDDLGVEKTSDWSLQTFYTIINRRSNKHLPTVITTNLSMDEIGLKLGGRIASRIKGMCKVIHIGGRDKRLSK